MKPSPASYDRSKLHELASAIMDGTASESQQRELTSLLSENVGARDEYLSLVDLHAVLATELFSSNTETSDVVEASLPPTGIKADRWRTGVGIAALAASLLVIVIPAALYFRPARPADEFAMVAQVTEAVWHSEDLEVGDRISPGTLHLRSGIVRLEFDSGVEVTLQGPSEFELISASKTNLRSGLLTADVPPGAEGFTVDTPTAAVVDLGTSFGIDLRENGQSNVSVFDGEVEVAIRDRSDKRRVTEGKSIRIGNDRSVEVVELDPQPFATLWPTASGIAGSTDTVQLLPPWPRQIRYVRSDSTMFVAVERRSVSLDEPLPVNISEPGEYARQSDLTPLEISSEKFVRSYGLHYAPVQRVGPRRASRLTGSITFDQPILGVIVQQDELLASSFLFSRRGKGEANPRRELQLTGEANGDRIFLSEDRMTLTLDLISPGRSSDLVRVIVEDDRRARRHRHRQQRRKTFSSDTTNAENKE